MDSRNQQIASLPIKPTTSFSEPNQTRVHSGASRSPESTSTTPRTTSLTSSHSSHSLPTKPYSLPSRPTTSLSPHASSSSAFSGPPASLPPRPAISNFLPSRPSTSTDSSSSPAAAYTTMSNGTNGNGANGSGGNPFALPMKPLGAVASNPDLTRKSHSTTPPPPPPSAPIALNSAAPSEVKREEQEEKEVKKEEMENRMKEEEEEVKPEVEEMLEVQREVREELKAEEVETKIEERSGSGSEVEAKPSGSRSPVDPKEEEEEEEEDEDPVKSNRRKSVSTTTKSTGTSKRKSSRSTPESEPQLIGHLPLAEEAAAQTYTEIPESSYFNKSLGNTPYYDPGNAQCDCVYRPDSKIPMKEQACGEYSSCMNRMLQMECEKGECRCGGKCQNQRFQNREYAPIEIVKTEKKGFGVRTTIDLTADTFIYEYVGEVIGPAPFARKMKEYASEGIKHFYFMALDKEVFIDATKKGGKGRFLNHSCNPNCQVAKWTVGKKMRMGIFTKRDVKKDEELTFNYNVDRYGHLAQECFCGEPNCVGFIGGKTQTDIGGMDDLYIDALGIAEEVEALQLKGSKKKKGRKLDEDYNPTLGPIDSDEVPKVASAIRQALQTRRILTKLLERVQITDDEEVQRQVLRLHGLSLMNNILREYPKDNEVLLLDLTILKKWKFQTRNKIETSKIEDQLQLFKDYEDEKIATMAKELLERWGELAMGFRIPKTQRDAESDLKRPSPFDIDQLAKRARLDESDSNGGHDSLFDRSKFVRPEANTTVSLNRPRKLPPGWSLHTNESGKEYYRNDLSGSTQWELPLRAAEPPTPKTKPIAQTFDANALVAEAERAAKEAKEAESKRIEEEENERKREREERHRRKKEEKEERERAQKEKKVMGLFSAVVVSTMSKYRSQFEAEAFKKRAKEVTQILLDKEKKRPSYDTDSYESLSTEKEAKVKSFVKDWIKKLLERKKSSRSGSTSGSSTPKPSSSSTPRPSLSKLNSSSSLKLSISNGVEIDSPATPQTAPMDLDTPTTTGDDKYSNGETPRVESPLPATEESK